MKKQIYITNGMARCGKDTFAKFVNDITPTLKYSSIDYIKIIAKLCGWDGKKTEKDRKFLSDLKELTTQYNDLAFNSIKEKVEEFYNDDSCYVMIIDIREPKEIERAKIAFDAKTILIENNNVDIIESNMADANVFKYNYDYIIQNNGTLEEFQNNVYGFVYSQIINNN